MKQTGLIRLALGFLLVFGAVGGMENPDQARYFLEQILVALAGIAVMLWAVRDINRQADTTINNLKR
jgi:cell division protein FtsW (lipid II flippase)